VHGRRVEGPGGLPVGVSGRVVALLSGGIDSPVASHRMMVRGCSVIGLHLWNRTFSGDGVRDKLLDLGRALAPYQGRFRLHFVPFEDIQQELIAMAPAPLRMLLYRRAMLRVANHVRRIERADATVTGDAVGQVASQTLSNLATVYEAGAPPILSPLCGARKRDIVDEARRIGTYEISIRPGDDCCGLLVARHPATSSRLEDLRAIEAECALEERITEALAARETHVLE
jgi:thiamine biosynthesis protein ThiI